MYIWLLCDLLWEGTCTFGCYVTCFEIMYHNVPTYLLPSCSMLGLLLGLMWDVMSVVGSNIGMCYGGNF